MLLPHHFIKETGSPFARKYLITHLISDTGVNSDGHNSALMRESQEETGDDLCQPHPGTRVDCYRCSLPGLAGFAVYRCEGTNRGHHNVLTSVRRRHINQKPVLFQAVIVPIPITGAASDATPAQSHRRG